jgi:hypothetical protein
MTTDRRAKRQIKRAPSESAPSPPATVQVSLGYDPTGEMEPVDIVSTREGWSEYTLSDGTVIRAKAVILDAKKAVNQYAQDGNPIYLMQFAFVNHLKVPAELKKGGIT